MKYKNYARTVFLVFAATNLISQISGWIIPEMISKTLLMPALAGYIYSNVKEKTGLTYGLLLAIILSWFGDTFLIFQAKDQIYFMSGLVAFLLAHVTYIFIFVQSSADFKAKFFTYTTGFLFIVYGLLLLLLLWPGLGGLRIPVIVYTVIIMSMSIMALFRKAVGANLVLIGAVFFVTSDSLLAINKFYEPLAYGGLLIMASYIAAQLLITEGMILRINSGHSIK